MISLNQRIRVVSLIGLISVGSDSYSQTAEETAAFILFSLEENAETQGKLKWKTKDESVVENTLQWKRSTSMGILYTEERKESDTGSETIEAGQEKDRRAPSIHLSIKRLSSCSY